MTSNFFLNNAFTYSDRRRKGWKSLLRGLLSFYAVCLLGAISSVGVASWLFALIGNWWIAGLGGSCVAAGWNFLITSMTVWAPVQPRVTSEDRQGRPVLEPNLDKAIQP